MRNLSLDDENKVTLMEANVVGPLIILLETANIGAKEHAAATLSILSIPPENRSILLNSGILLPLINLLDCKDGYAQEAVITTLFNVSLSPENQVPMFESALVPSLLISLNGEFEYTARSHEFSMGILRNLAVAAENRVPMTKFEVIPAILKELLHGANDYIKEHASAALYNLSLCTENQLFFMETPDMIHKLLTVLSHNGLICIREFVTGVLRNMAVPAANRLLISGVEIAAPILNMIRIGNDSCKEHAVALLYNLSLDEVNQEIFLQADVIPPLLIAMTSENRFPTIKEFAAGCIRNLAVPSRNRKTIGSLNVVTPLLSIFNSGNDSTREHVIAALYNLTLCVDNQISFFRAGIVPYMVQGMTVDSTYPSAKEYSAGAIRNLAVTSKNRVPLLNCNVLPGLIALLSTGTVGAKEHAVAAIYNLSLAKTNQPILIKAGIIPLFLEIMCNDKKLVISEHAAGTFRSIAVTSKNFDELIDTGVIPAMIAMYNEEDTRIGTKEHINKTFNVMAENETIKQTLLALGATEDMLKLGSVTINHSDE